MKFVKMRDIRRRLIGCSLALIAAASAVSAQELPAGGTTAWTIDGAEEILTFVLFDPKATGVRVPKGLQLLSARDVGMPEVQAYLKDHPDHSGWAFSFVEITRSKAFVIDGKEPKLPKDGGIGLWFAPVDPSQLAAEIPKEKFDTVITPSIGSVLGLGLWIPDRDYVEYMRARGHHAEYGLVTLVKDTKGTYKGEIRLDDLHVRGSALPHGEVRIDPASGTQILFAPADRVVNAVVIAGGDARNMDCEGQWSKEGNHPLSRGVFVGPTYFTTYAKPLRGSAYPFQPAEKK